VGEVETEEVEVRVVEGVFWNCGDGVLTKGMEGVGRGLTLPLTVVQRLELGEEEVQTEGVGVTV